MFRTEENGSDATPEYTDGRRFVMPPEWVPHAATWISWPRREGISFPGMEEEAQGVWFALVEVLSRFEPVHVNVFDMAYYRYVTGELKRRGLLKGGRCQVHVVPAYEPWIRDHGPIFVFAPEAPELPVITDWRYNAWGGKYPPWDLDDRVPARVGSLLGCCVHHLPWILEGGAIEINGEGVLLASATCLLNENRNGPAAKGDLEAVMGQYLGAKRVVWVEGELEGDDTDGHVDQLARFVSDRVLVVAATDDPTDANFPVLRRLQEQLRAQLLETGLIDHLVSLHIPPRRVFRGQRLPMSYLNFYFVNGAVVVPTYEERTDDAAVSLLRELMPEREVVSFPARTMIWGLGAVHCATQQQPAGLPAT